MTFILEGGAFIYRLNSHLQEFFGHIHIVSSGNKFEALVLLDIIVMIE